MPFGQKLRSSVMSGLRWGKNMLQQTYHHGKHALSIMDKGMKTGSDIYQSIKPALQNLAPAQMQDSLQKLDSHVGKAQDKYNTMRNKIDQGEHHIASNVGMVMGNLKKKDIGIGLNYFFSGYYITDVS